MYKYKKAAIIWLHISSPEAVATSPKAVTNSHEAIMTISAAIVTSQLAAG